MPRRVENRIQKKHAVTILGEGITEQHYFTHIRTLFGYNYTIKPYYFSVTSLTEMDKKIAEAITDGGYAIAVFDADVISKINLTVISVTVIAYLFEYQRKENENLTLESCSEIAKAYSKEIEYNEDNCEAVQFG